MIFVGIHLVKRDVLLGEKLLQQHHPSWSIVTFVQKHGDALGGGYLFTLAKHEWKSMEIYSEGQFGGP